jgi:hypothetical protein
VPKKSAESKVSKVSMMFPLVFEGAHDPDPGPMEKSA